jgi:hypothetical protein
MANAKRQVNSAGEEWDVVSEPRSTIITDTLGDEWEGYYEGPAIIHNEVENEDYEYLNFRDSSGDPYQISASFDLKRAFENIPVGTYSKFVLVELKPRPKGNPLKLYKVYTRR